MDKDKLILIEQAWEDESGQYHDEYAKVLSISADGTMTLEFPCATPEVQEFLEGAIYNAYDYLPGGLIDELKRELYEHRNKV